MKIVLFEFLGLKIHSYGLMIAIGLITAMLLLNKRAVKKGYDDDSILNMTIITVIAGVLGGKLLYIITEFDYIKENPQSIIKEFGYGFVIYGAIIAGALSVLWYCKKKNWNVLEVFDLVIPEVALAQGFGRIGCFLAGCCYGAETTSSLSVVFPAGGMAPIGVHLHPTQLYSAAFDFILGFILLAYDNKKKSKGNTFALYLVMYSIGRFCIEFLRDDPRGSVGMVSTSQFIAIFTLILGIVIFNIHKIKGRIIKNEN